MIIFWVLIVNLILVVGLNKWNEFNLKCVIDYVDSNEYI